MGTTVAATINGFLVQARVPGDTPTLGQTPMLLGSFQTVSGQQNRDCDGAGVADQVLHLSFVWLPSNVVSCLETTQPQGGGRSVTFNQQHYFHETMLAIQTAKSSLSKNSSIP